MDLATLLFWTQFPVFALSVVWLARPTALRRLASTRWTRRRRICGALLAAMLPADLLLTSIDSEFSRAVGRDFARVLAVVEGPIPNAVQAWTPFPLTVAAVLVYTVGFPAFIAAALFRALGEEDGLVVRRLAVALLANYALALPFYFFVPVSEVHVVRPDVRHLIAETSRSLAEFHRPSSGIDNCFPSLHTSITITMLLSLPVLRMRHVLFGGFIVFTTLYLGIHWSADVAAGLLFGILCRRVGESVVARWWSETTPAVAFASPANSETGRRTA